MSIKLGGFYSQSPPEIDSFINIFISDTYVLAYLWHLVDRFIKIFTHLRTSYFASCIDKNKSTYEDGGAHIVPAPPNTP